jgi:hypothetical protein
MKSARSYLGKIILNGLPVSRAYAFPSLQKEVLPRTRKIALAKELTKNRGGVSFEGNGLANYQ